MTFLLPNQQLQSTEGKGFTYKMAAKINWHRYGTKLRHRHPMYTPVGG